MNDSHPFQSDPSHPSKWLYPFKYKVMLGLLALLASLMLVMAFAIRDVVEDDSEAKTRELCAALESQLVVLMESDSKDGIEKTLHSLPEKSDSILRSFITTSEGDVVWASDEELKGQHFHKDSDASCVACHEHFTGDTAAEMTLHVSDALNGKYHRHIRILENGKNCQACHGTETHVLGKLVIDRSLATTYLAIGKVELLMLVISLVGGSIFLLLASNGMNRFIGEVLHREHELGALYRVVNELSKSIDVGELKYIVVGILGEIFGAQRVDMVLNRPDKDHRCITWEGEGGGIHRTPIQPDSALDRVLTRWRTGALKEVESSQDRTRLFLPVAQGNRPLALAALSRLSPPFNTRELQLSAILARHMATAFENARLYTLAITDDLTGIYARRPFYHIAERRLALFAERHQKLALLFIDIDLFKQVNDVYGHPVGDTVIRRVTDSLRNSSRDTDLIFRLGGEEFAIVLGEPTEARDAFILAERLREAVETAPTREGEPAVTISIGVALYPDDAPNLEKLVESADKALYQAKQTGRNCTCLAGTVQSEDLRATPS